MSPIGVPADGLPQGPRPTLPQVETFHLPQRQDWAVLQQRQNHDQALYAMGEYAVFVLMWQIQDLEDGYVERCPRCFVGDNTIADVYKQPVERNCPFCYGTTFAGGYKAILVRPSIWDANEEDYRSSARGETIVQTASVQTTADFRLRTGDYVMRSDGSRYQMRTMSSNELRTGFSTPGPNAVVGYNYGTCSREDESSVAYLLPPTPQALRERLSDHGSIKPMDFSDMQVLRGPVVW